MKVIAGLMRLDIIDPNGSRIPLFYDEVKIDANDKYHPIPRTRPSEG
jgi:hypothetical protein